jgi:hypothetical protein
VKADAVARRDRPSRDSAIERDIVLCRGGGVAVVARSSARGARVVRMDDRRTNSSGECLVCVDAGIARCRVDTRAKSGGFRTLC